jgi:hypothetical protein
MATVDPTFYRTAADAAAAPAATDVPGLGNELHHFGWNACSSALKHEGHNFPHGEEFRGLRVHQIRLQGGDASSDSYCYR